MGRYGAYDLYVAPFVRDFTVLLPMVAVWFVLQWAMPSLYTRIFGAGFTRLSPKKREDVVVRSVSVLNSFLMTGAAACFLSNLYAHNFTLPGEYYGDIPGYCFFRISIVSYFVWDIAVCFMYGWGELWKIHAIASLLGAYLLSFPFSDHYASYFTGMFELSNAPLHLSVIMRTLDVKALNPFVMVMEGAFALLFVVIRVLGGTIVAAAWLKLSCIRLVANYHTGGRLLHGEVPVVIAMTLIVVIQLLQYIWCVEVTRRVIEVLAPSATMRWKAKQIRTDAIQLDK
ncbi:hypothetical protein C3747_95g105 [Trypanosoma cruzi]|uniref:TLC domain-containing protein n=2 Tax=Trypanosoma cruzi TaxID=5693 RepID=Q4DSX0_TRYCC|nr:hypothetical protein, conserved [Trypanosoma cruzi]EAN95633.1 hypothetical protein, conserved [Trypanosoma cruzi]PWV08047.1 hypothetical protein C3747_95g105 [Trypanosoma cruzi]RNC60820.1 hypothetical protein TcCL_ESM01476 [Trypanosoma cruzi]|eukprot:XP_817484.1 hypothetical protein [Trypanosoma cruzi strain CL Brener]